VGEIDMARNEPQCNDQYIHSTKTKKAVLNTYLGKILGAEKAAQLLRIFFLDVSQKTDQLKKYLCDRNMIEIRKIAHALKGSGKSYGFQDITEMGKKLSTYAKCEDYSGLRDLIKNLDVYTKKQKKILS
jgi:HPt (histidine-containing phosphotransfer) domain-containing protein